MTIKVYVNDNHEIIGENQYKKLLDEKFYGLGRDTLRNLFDEWFNLLYNEEYKAYDLLVFDAEKRSHIFAKFKAWVSIAITNALKNEWSEREIEI